MRWVHGSARMATDAVSVAACVSPMDAGAEPVCGRRGRERLSRLGPRPLLFLLTNRPL